MSYSLDETKGKVRKSLYLLWRKDRHVLEVNASERSITHRFAVYLEQEFADYKVDCEYNREGDDPKRYHEIVCQINKTGISAGDTEAKTAFPDIIVHKRGNNKDNLLVIEGKKLTGGTIGIDEIDKKKLMAFLDTNQLNYKYGLAMQIPVGGGNMAKLFWFERGNTHQLCVENYNLKTNESSCSV